MLKAVIFDMDGVIIDSEPIHAKASVIAMEKLNITITEDYCYRFIGSTTKFMLQTIKDEFNSDISVTKMNECYMETLHKCIEDEGYTEVPHVVELIKSLYKAGLKLSIASSSTTSEISDVVKQLKIAKYFDCLVSGATVENPKPAPDIFIKACKELGVSPKECIVIEDSMNGVISGTSAGISCVGYINKNSGNQDLSKASMLVESFESINYDFLERVLKRAHGEPITIANTKRLVIRELSVQDITAMYDIYQNKEVKKYIHDIDDYLDVEIEKHKAYIKNVYAFYGYGLWGVFSKEDGTLIGRCGIQNREINGKSEIELGYLLDVKHWGYGYAVECSKSVLKYAFETLELDRIVAVMDQLNTRSIKVAEHIGMRLEAEVTDHNRPCYLYVAEREGVF